MAKLGNVYFPAVITLVLIRSKACFKYLDIDVHKQCTQTARNSLYSTPVVTIPKHANAIGVLEIVSEYKRLKMDLCPDNRFLKISWTINRTQECDVMICFKMENSQNEAILDTVCYNIHIHRSNYTSAMDCWFPVDFIDYRPIITAWTLPTQTSAHGLFFGSLNTSALDPFNSCRDICEVIPMRVGSQINCKETAFITFDRSAVVEHLSVNNIDKSSCKNGIKILKQSDGQLEYQFNCSFSGVGYIKILYSIHGKYCLKYQMIKIHCPYDYFSDHLANGLEDTHSFGTFMIFGLVCIVVIAATFFTIVFVVQWLYDRTYHIKSHHRRHSDGAGPRHVSMKREETFPLQTFSPQPSGSRLIPCVITTDAFEANRTSPRQRSASSTSDKMPEEENDKRSLLVLPMRRSITMALLEETDPFYKKRILFLPIPFDHYTNDVTKILKSVFTDEAGIPSQCCFDRKLFQEYITGDRFRWIENVLGDHDKILIFLCFTSLNLERGETKRDSMAEEILDNILATKIKSHRLCKVVLLYLTDSPDSVQTAGKFLTDSFHISSSDCYAKFVSNIMNFCGRNPQENPEVIVRLSNCKASKHFLRFIGIKDIL